LPGVAGVILLGWDNPDMPPAQPLSTQTSKPVPVDRWKLSVAPMMDCCD